MKTSIFVLAILFASVGIFAQSVNCNTPTQNLTVLIEGFENDNGNVRIGIYASEATWLKKVHFSQIQIIENGKASAIFENVPQGEYAISVYHDENANQKLDKGYFGIPTESYACSNGATGRFGPPAWADAKFKVAGEDRELKLKF